MGPDFLDQHSRLASPIHRASARLKLIVVLAFIVTTVVMPAAAWWWAPAAAGLLATIAVLSRVPPAFLLRRLALLEPFVLGVALLSLLQPGGARIFANMIVRSTLCLFALILLAATTSFGDLLAALRSMRVPGIIVTTLALMCRYIYVLADEAGRMRRARASRTFVRSRVGSWRMLADVAARLFVRSSERSERIYAAMCARGWRL